MAAKETAKGLYINVSKELHKEIKAQALQKDMSMKDYILAAVHAYMKN